MVDKQLNLFQIKEHIWEWTCQVPKWPLSRKCHCAPSISTWGSSAFPSCGVWMLLGSLERPSGSLFSYWNACICKEWQRSWEQLFCRKPEFEGQKKIKKLVIWSFGGFLVWSVGLIAWIATFTINRYLHLVRFYKWSEVCSYCSSL